jgi:anti-sigma B factor antagonist
VATNLLPDERRAGPHAQSELSVTSDELDDLVLVSLRGELDVYTVSGFWQRVRRYDPAQVRLVIDVTAVTLLDSAGISALLSLRNRAHRSGARLTLVCSHHLRRLLRVIGLQSSFTLADDLAGVRNGLRWAR